MKFLAVITLFLAMLGQAHADDSALYEQLSKAKFMEDKFVSSRTATGIDFNSMEKLAEPFLASHAKYHLEIEGLLPIKNASSIQNVAEMIAAAIKLEVDQTQEQINPIIPGVNVDFIDINGSIVALLSYKSNTEDNPYRQRLIILANGGIYTLTLSLHTQDEMDKMGMYLFMVATAMINSNEIDLVRF